MPLHVSKYERRDSADRNELAAAALEACRSAKSVPGVISSLFYWVNPDQIAIITNAGDGGFNFVVILPDHEIWGKLAKAYSGSAAQKADEVWGEVATCKGTSLWASEKIK